MTPKLGNQCLSHTGGIGFSGGKRIGPANRDFRRIPLLGKSRPLTGRNMGLRGMNMNPILGGVMASIPLLNLIKAFRRFSLIRMLLITHHNSHRHHRSSAAEELMSLTPRWIYPG